MEALLGVKAWLSWGISKCSLKTAVQGAGLTRGFRTRGFDQVQSKHNKEIPKTKTLHFRVHIPQLRGRDVALGQHLKILCDPLFPCPWFLWKSASPKANGAPRQGKRVCVTDVSKWKPEMRPKPDGCGRRRGKSESSIRSSAARWASCACAAAVSLALRATTCSQIPSVYCV
jgi:hypothetical protein